MNRLNSKVGAPVARFLSAIFAAIVASGCASASTGAGVSEAKSSPEGEAHSYTHEGPHHHSFDDADKWTKVFDDPERDEWQRPADVIDAMELSPAMVVADLGAGTGYFAVRLAHAVPEGEVIATDVEPDMVRFLNERASREKLTNLRGLLATQSDSGLSESSVDRILVVNVWHHLSERIKYARKLVAALRPGGRLLIVEFSEGASRGPPAKMRLAPELLIAELTKAGLSAKLLPVSLPDQYIVEARLP